LNLHQVHVEVNGKQVLLTPRELSLLRALMMNSGRILNRDQLIQIAWGHHFAGTARTVDVYVERLRKKIQPHLSGAFYIRAVRGFGYSLTPPQGRVALKPIPTASIAAL
jgi:two-component system alkaline phosphatase synthesis response regulator PhoP